jgi:hypothetical protein
LPHLPDQIAADENGMLSEAVILRQRVNELDEELAHERETHQQTQVELLVAREQFAELRGMLTQLQTVDLNRQQLQADLLVAHTALGQAQAEQEQLKQRIDDLQADLEKVRRRLRWALTGAVIVISVLIVMVAVLVGQGVISPQIF